MNTAQPPFFASNSQSDDNSYVDDYQPPASSTPVVNDDSSKSSTVESVKTESTVMEPLQDQNIFYLLGVEESTEGEKEAFLDELQQVIWEDFIETDVKMIISPEEMAQLGKILEKGNDQNVQEEALVFLEKLVPDLEEIMLEKALELKEDMVMERIAKKRKYNSKNTEVLAKVDEAENLIKQDKWAQAAAILNAA